MALSDHRHGYLQPQDRGLGDEGLLVRRAAIGGPSDCDLGAAGANT
jgi:hypothetical protein